MTQHDQFISSEASKYLAPGEQITHMAFMVKAPPLWVQIFLIGGLLLFLMIKPYYVVATQRRLILLRTKQGMFKPSLVVTEQEEIDLSQVQEVKMGGFANNRSMEFIFRDGSKRTLRIAPWLKFISGQKQFFEQIPQMINSGHFAQAAALAGPPMGQLPAGAPQMQGAPHMQGAPPAGAPMGGPPPGAPAPGGFAPGMQVQIRWNDGQVYPGTVVQAQPGQVLCAFPNGQQHWVPEAQLSA